MKRFNLKSLLLIVTLLLTSTAKLYSAGGEAEPLKVDWSFKGITGKFDRASLQRGFQVYKEVCSSCHSMQYLSYRNLGEPGVPEFSEQEVKAIAASVEITDGPDDQGEMFTRPGRPADKFKNPYPNVKASIAANGGAYPPDMSVLVKARPDGSNYIFSVLVGYEDPPEIMKFIRDFINPKKLYKQALEKKIMMFYEALGWDEPTDATKTIERFFWFWTN